MKITTFIIFIFCLHVSAKTSSQTISFSAQDIKMEKVFAEFEKQSGFVVVYKKGLLKYFEPVTLDVKEMAVKEFLKLVTAKKGLEFLIENKTVILRKQIEDVNPRLNLEDSEPSSPPITGVVRDSSGNVLSGATIYNKRTKKSVQTNAKGEFNIEAQDDDILQISFIGFEHQNIKVAGSSLHAILRASTSPLDEVQIMAYGKTSKRISVGNISTVKAEDIQKQPVSDPMLTLQGRVPGMIVTQTTGLSGGQIKVQIRGMNSLNNGTQPLLIVDGVPYQINLPPLTLGNYGALDGSISALHFINPADIESIDVLKDADATAIYGSRGANGVILVTTRKGKAGDTKVNISFNNGWQKVGKKVKMLNTTEYLAMRREAFINDGITPDIDNAPDLKLWDTTRYTNWHDQLIGGVGKYTDVQASVSGGSPALQFVLGGNYHNETTVFPGDFYTRRGGAHFNITNTSKNQRFRTSLTVNYSINNSNNPGVDFSNYINLAPNAPNPYNEDGTLNWEGSSWDNPYALIESRVLQARTNNLVTNIDLGYVIFKEFKFKINIGYNEVRNNNFSGNKIAGVNPVANPDAKASAIFSSNNLRSWISEPQLTYNVKTGYGNVNLLVGSTFQGSKSEGQGVFVLGIPQDALIRFPLAGTFYLARGTGANYRYVAVFSRVEYNYENKYLANITVRRDGSSRFGSRERFANFGSIGTAWVFSEAKFMNAFNFLSFAKLRATYGITGNDQIGDYKYINTYNFVEQAYQNIKGYRVGGLYNPDYVWERTKKAEIGLETGFFKDKLYLSASWYRNKSDNQLLTYNLPAMTGSSSILGNLPVIIHNTGFEMVATSQNIKHRNFEWSTTLNFSITRNKLVSDDGQTLGSDRKVGMSLNNKNVYAGLGLDAETGQFIFKDVEGKPTAQPVFSPRDVFVNLFPAYFGGVQNTFKLGDFLIDIFFQYTKQQGTLNGLYANDASPGTIKNQPVEVLERWQSSTKPGKIQKFSTLSTYQDSFYGWLESDAVFTSASFFRLKNLMLSWRLPRKIATRLSLDNAKIYIQGQNLFTLTSYPGWDPETQSIRSLPPLRNFTIGVNLSF